MIVLTSGSSATPHVCLARPADANTKDLGREQVLEATPQLPQASLLHRGAYESRDHNAGEVISATIITTVDAPMGSSSALVDAFRTLLDAPLGQYDVAHLTFEIERIDLGMAGGKQDQ